MLNSIFYMIFVSILSAALNLHKTNYLLVFVLIFI